MYYVYAAINKLASIIAHKHHLKPSRPGFLRVVVRAGLPPIFVGRFSCRKSNGPSHNRTYHQQRWAVERVCWLRWIGFVGLLESKLILKLLKPTMHLQNTGGRKLSSADQCGTSVVDSTAFFKIV